jgi:general secretion pathway protein B
VSFILDALRKSEHARQKTSGPGLAEIPVAVSQRRTNAWAIAAVALIVVNLLAVGVWLVRRAGTAQAPAAVTAAAEPASAPVHTANITRAQPPVANAPAPINAPAPRGSAANPPAVVEPGRNPLAEEVGPGLDPTLQAGAESVPPGPPAVTASGRTNATRRGSVVYAPVPEATDVPDLSPPAQDGAATSREPAPPAESMPTADDLTARGGLPPLHLDLHVYAASAQQRFIFVNSRRYREGDTLQEGPVVEKITPDGAVLSYNGSRFKLTSR